MFHRMLWTPYVAQQLLTSQEELGCILRITHNSKSAALCSQRTHSHCGLIDSCFDRDPFRCSKYAWLMVWGTQGTYANFMEQKNHTCKINIPWYSEPNDQCSEQSGYCNLMTDRIIILLIIIILTIVIIVMIIVINNSNNNNFVALVRQRTKTTERPPLVEVNVNFCE
jgi:hypothetical protein